jgi:hypothetical protein
MSEEDKRILGRLETKIDNLTTSVGILFKAIEGNGQPGLKQDMAVLKSEHAACMRDREIEKNNEPQKQNNLIAWLALVSVIVMTAVQIIIG